MEPAALYLHIPFCLRRCDYCDFTSSIYNPEIVQVYLEAIRLELKKRAANLVPQTIYIGGGTPTSLSLSELKLLFQNLSILDLSGVEEFTIEANPGTINVEKMLLLREFNVNRLSLGIQTFSEKGLQTLGRNHNALQARSAVSICREAGFDNLSLDLINSWPGQKLDDLLLDLTQAARLKAQHLSCYSLVYETGTKIFKAREAGKITPVSLEIEREMFDLVRDYLPKQGYQCYEVSSHTQPGFQCRHNIAYWQGAEYLGIGSGAHSYLAGKRFSNCSNPKTYSKLILNSDSAVTWEEQLAPEHRARELAVIWLRLTEGIEINKFHNLTGYKIEELFAPEIKKLEHDGWLEYDQQNLKLTEKAAPVADSILMELV